jgi:hypothetical protein
MLMLWCRLSSQVFQLFIYTEATVNLHQWPKLQIFYARNLQPKPMRLLWVAHNQAIRS